MSFYYLKNHQIGASSRQIYGLKGDKVSIITYSINMRLVQSVTTGHKFWVNVNNLSDVPVEKEIVYEQQKNTKSIKSNKKR